MNFTESQRTGLLAEGRVALLFEEWFWTVGYDRIDVGYDLLVEPDQKQFKGHRFLVQVKGTASRKKGNIIASVSKQRLRQYAANPLPVFLVRVTPDGKMYWLHVQPWATTNKGRLVGNGDAGVRMIEGQLLEDQIQFTSYLAEIFKPLAEQTGAAGHVANERSVHLSSIDSRFKVRVDVIEGQEQYVISGCDDGAKATVQFEASEDPRNIANVDHALRYGVPTTVELKSFRMTGSELFEVLRMNQLGPQSVTIASNLTTEGSVSLRAGAKYSITAEEFEFPARSHRGQAGFAVTNERFAGPFNFQMLGEPKVMGGTDLHFNMGLRGDRLSEMPLKALSQLKQLGTWAGDALKQEGTRIELNFYGKRIPIQVDMDSQLEMRDFLKLAHAFGQLHEIARALDSDFIMDKDQRWCLEEIEDIQVLYRILKGERVEVSVSSFNFLIDDPAKMGLDAQYVVKTIMTYSFGNRRFGDVPVAFDLEGYELRQTSEMGHCRMEKVATSKAHLYYRET